jgi:excisionase family DNA binding protein
MPLIDTLETLMEKQLLTDKEIGAILGCSYRHVKTLRLKRLIPFVRLGRLVRYNPQEVMKAIEKLTTKEHDHSKSKLFK